MRKREGLRVFPSIGGENPNPGRTPDEFFLRSGVLRALAQLGGKTLHHFYFRSGCRPRGARARFDGLGRGEDFCRRVSSAAEERAQLEALSSFVSEGDTVAVVKLNRLARSTADAIKLRDRIAAKSQ